MLEWLKALRGRRVERKLMAWHMPGRAVWSPRDASVFAREGYAKNAVAYRCVRLIAEAAASAPLRVGPSDHPLAALLARPNPEQTGVELREAFFGHLQVSGNAYLEAAAIDDQPPRELYVLRPDRMSVIPGLDGWPIGWEHRVAGNVRRFDRDPVTNDAPILHLKLFHPHDARPHPAFPARDEFWADGASWRRGHWLTGRAGLATLPDVVSALCQRAGVEEVETAALSGVVAGYVVDAPAPMRAALEPLMAAYGFAAREQAGALVFAHTHDAQTAELTLDDLTAESVAEVFQTRSDIADAPIEARIRYLDAERDYLVGSVSARRRDAADGGVAALDAPLVLDEGQAEALAERVLAGRRAVLESGRIETGPAQLALEPGDQIAFAGETFRIARIEDAAARTLELARAPDAAPLLLHGGAPAAPPPAPHAPTPELAILDLPPLPGAEDDDRPLAALAASPWTGPHAIYVDGGKRGEAANPAVMGELLWDFWPGPIDRWDEGNIVRIRLYAGALASVTREAALAGAVNIFAIEGEGGEWEIVQARDCVLVGENEYELSGFLRGLLGSAHAQGAPTPAGRRIVKLDQRLARLSIAAHEWGGPLAFAAPPRGLPLDSAAAALESRTLAHVAQRPFPPVRLRAHRDGAGDAHLSWIRQARKGGLAWGPGDPPLGEAAERYLLEILDGAGAVLRSVETAAPSFLYDSAAQSADFGAPPTSLRFRVGQIGADGLPGLKTERTLPL